MSSGGHAGTGLGGREACRAESDGVLLSECVAGCPPAPLLLECCCSSPEPATGTRLCMLLCCCCVMGHALLLLLLPGLCRQQSSSGQRGAQHCVYTSNNSKPVREAASQGEQPQLGAVIILRLCASRRAGRLISLSFR